MSSYSYPTIQNSIPEALIPSAINGTNSEDKDKLFQAFLIALPICVSVFVLIGYYIFYRCGSSINVDTNSLYVGRFNVTNNISMVERGMRNDSREMLRIVIFGESFAVNETQCSVCLGDYEAGEKLQQLAACGHTFHMECIGTWITSRATCPLCRVFLIPGVSRDWYHQTLNFILSMENSNAGPSVELESTREPDGQEGNGEIREVIYENARE